MKYIVARDYNRYREWLRANKMSPFEARYLDRREKVLGLELNKEDVIDLGGGPPEVYEELRFRVGRRA